MKKQLFLYLGILALFFVACKESKATSEVSTQIAIEAKISELYTKYGTSNEAVYKQPISDDIFSSDLKKKLEQAIGVSKADIEKVKNSDHPDEKPLIFEGAIFSSLYEGYTSYQIQSVKVNGKTADALVRLEYDMASPKVSWVDTIHLIDSDKGWKVDNITFDSIGNSKDLKTRLTDFVKSTQ